MKYGDLSKSSHGGADETTFLSDQPISTRSIRLPSIPLATR